MYYFHLGSYCNINWCNDGLSVIIFRCSIMVTSACFSFRLTSVALFHCSLNWLNWYISLRRQRNDGKHGPGFACVCSPDKEVWRESSLFSWFAFAGSSRRRGNAPFYFCPCSCFYFYFPLLLLLPLFFYLVYICFPLLLLLPLLFYLVYICFLQFLYLPLLLRLHLLPPPPTSASASASTAAPSDSFRLLLALLLLPLLVPFLFLLLLLLLPCS